MRTSRKPLLFSIEPSLGALEQEVMLAVWSYNAKTVRDVRSRLSERNPAYTTIMTVMDHLYRKGFLQREKAGKTYVYAPVAKKRTIISRSLAYLFRQITEEHGRAQALWTFVLHGLLRLPEVAIELKPLRASAVYKQSIGLSIPLVPILILLVILTIDVVENFNILGTFEYASLLLKEPLLTIDKAYLVLLALGESLPLTSFLLIILLSTALFFIVRKLMKLFEEDFRAQPGGRIAA